MKILILDVANDAYAAAVCEAGDVLGAEVRDAERGRAEMIYPIAESALAEARLDWSSIDRLAVIAGPGSFTGVRVGVAAARGLALGLGRPAFGVDGFDAYARAVAGTAPSTRRLVVVFGRSARLLWRRFDLHAVGEDAKLARPTTVDAAMQIGSASEFDAAMAAEAEAVICGPAVFDSAPEGVLPTIEIEEHALLSAGAAMAAADLGTTPPTPIYGRAPDAAPSSSRPPRRLDAL